MRHNAGCWDIAEHFNDDRVAGLAAAFGMSVRSITDARIVIIAGLENKAGTKEVCLRCEGQLRLTIEKASKETIRALTASGGPGSTYPTEFILS